MEIFWKILSVLILLSSLFIHSSSYAKEDSKSRKSIKNFEKKKIINKKKSVSKKSKNLQSKFFSNKQKKSFKKKGNGYSKSKKYSEIPSQDFLNSNVAYIKDLKTSTVLFSKNSKVISPIASISKLMSAIIVTDMNQSLDELLEITKKDIDSIRHTYSRLPIGTKLTRNDMLHLSLMSSENRATNALSRYYPGGISAFIKAMNKKAHTLGMYSTYFHEPTGLSSKNVSSPEDLVILIKAASERFLIHQYSTADMHQVRVKNGKTEIFRNTNSLIRRKDWDIRLSKTGYINESGKCLVMLVRVNKHDLAIVLLNSHGNSSRIVDAIKLKKFLNSKITSM